MTQDSAGRLWVATVAGAWRAGADGKFAPVPSEEGLPAAGACSFLSEPGGRVWIGFENGLASWRDGKATFRQTGKGIPVRRVAGIYPPENGKLWFSSPEGLTSLSIADFEQDSPGARVFTRADGLPTAEASSGFHPCVWRSGNGHFWLPTHLGLVEFDPKTMPPPAAPPSVVIEEATASFEEKHQSLTVPPLDRQPGSLDKGDSLEAGLRRLEFRFTAPSLSAPGNVRFRWKLEGLDAAWSDPSPQRTATYATVPPGNYRFRVLACNGDGVWNETGAAVPFLIPPLWHERPAVWVAAAALAVMVAGFAVRSRYGRRIELLRLRSTLEHERARIAQDIHDDLGATLTQISLWSAFAQKRAEEGLAGHLAKIRERSIDAVRSLDQIVWAVNPSNDTVKNFATYVCQMAGDFFRETAVACRIDLKEPVEDGPLNADVRHHLVLAAREACTNALRHSGGTEVLLHVRAEEGRILIIVNDNGCGFDPAKITGESEGLTGMSRRLRSIGGRCEVRSAPGEGTQVQVEWPSREAEAAD
jgi:signal transduction histidine kinase